MIIAVNFPISAIGRKKPEKYQGFNGIRTRDLCNTGAMLNPTNWPRSQWTQQIDLALNVWLHSSVGRASHRYRRGHRFESHWSPDNSQASSFQLLKLENLLRWSLFTFIYNRSTNMDYIYISRCLHIVINSKWTMFKNCKKTAIRVSVEKILEDGITSN